MEKIFTKISQWKLLPAIALPDIKFAKDLAQTLTKAGLPCAEVTFRTDAAEEAIRVISESFPEMLVGAGTVLNVDQAKRAIDAGAKFIVSPGLSHAVLKWCLNQNIPVIPGVATSSEIMAALDHGLEVLKFFPSENLGGISILKALYGPFKEVKFIPSGGINIENLPQYLALPNVLAAGGTWFVREQLIAAGKFEEIKQLTKDALSAAHNI